MMRDLETDEAGTDHDGPARLCRLRNQGPTVRQSAQIVDLRQIAAGKGELDRLGAGGQQQRAVAMPAAVRKLDLPGIGVDRNRASTEPQLDPLLSIELERAQRYPFLGRVAGKIVLRQIGPVAGRRVIVAQHRDRA